MKQLKLAVLCAWCLQLFLPSFGMAQDYTFAVVPQTQVSDIYERWMPFLKKLSQEIGAEIKIIPYNTIRQFEGDLQKGVPDFAYVNPFQEVNAKETQGYLPLVKDKADLSGILVVNKSGAINSIKDLEGKELVFPSHAFAANHYLRALLMEKEKLHFKSQYVKSHGSVYRAIKLNTASAGGGVMKTLAQETDDIQSQLKTIYQTPSTASHPIVAHPRVPESLRQKVAQAILNFGKGQPGKDMLKNIQVPNPVTADYQRDYASLKKLEGLLNKYEEPD